MLRERLATLETGGYVPKDKETVAQFMQRWLDTYAATNTRLRTQEGYKGNFRRYIIPAIGHVSLQGLTARHIQRMYSDLLKRELSGTTVLHVHRLLHKSISDAVKWGLLTRNVADAAPPPAPRAKRASNVGRRNSGPVHGCGEKQPISTPVPLGRSDWDATFRISRIKMGECRPVVRST